MPPESTVALVASLPVVSACPPTCDQAGPTVHLQVEGLPRCLTGQEPSESTASALLGRGGEERCQVGVGRGGQALPTAKEGGWRAGAAHGPVAVG